MAFGLATSTDCLFSSSPIPTVRIANSRETQQLETCLRYLDSEMRRNLTLINFCTKKTNKTLEKMKNKTGIKSAEKTRPNIDKDDCHKELVTKLFRPENDPEPSIKRLITHAMEQFELRGTEESEGVAAGDDLDEISTENEKINQTKSTEMKEVVWDNTALHDSEIMTVQELKSLIEHIYGSNSDDFSMDSVMECLLPILHKTKVGATECQLGKINDHLLLLKQILASEFPEVSDQHEEAHERKLWKKFNTCKTLVLPPIHQHKNRKLVARSWDFDTTTKVSAQVTDEEWEELRYCHYLRPPVTKP